MSRQAMRCRLDLADLAKLLRKKLAGAPLAAEMLLTVERDEVCGPRYTDGLSDLAHIADEIKGLRGLLADYIADRIGEEACAVQ